MATPPTRLQTDIVTVMRYDAAGRMVDRLHYGRDATADHKLVDVDAFASRVLAEDEARLGRKRARSGAEKVLRSVGFSHPGRQYSSTMDWRSRNGLHGERAACFVCGGPVEQVPMVQVAAADDADTRPAVEVEHQRLREGCGTVLGILCNIRDDASDAHEIHDGGEQPVEVELLAILEAAKRGIATLAPVIGLTANTHSEETERVCGRLLVGRGSDTYDPLCVLAAGHEGPCAL